MLIGTPFDGLAPIFGVKGVGMAMAFFAAALVSGWTGWIAAVLVAVLCAGLALIQFTEKVDPKEVGIVQVNIPLTDKWAMAQRGETFRIYSQLSHQLSPKDLVLWSEAAFATSRPFMLEALETVRGTSGHKYLASGYIESSDAQRFNSLLIAGADQANYRKLRLVPYGEYVPLRSLVNALLGDDSVPYSDLSPGDHDERSLNVHGLKLAPAICYEASFENDVNRAVNESDADAILVVSEDAWFGDSFAPHQNFEMARMRAREHGRYVVRAANSGISGIVDPEGKVIARAEQFTRTTIDGQIFTMHGTTPFTRYGRWLLSLLLALSVTWVVLVQATLYWRGADK